MTDAKKNEISQVVTDLKDSIEGQPSNTHLMRQLDDSNETLDQILAALVSLTKKIDSYGEDEQDTVVADLTVATRMPDEVLAHIQQLLSTNIGREVSLVQIIDPSIIGGLILVVGDERHDISIKSQLDRLRKEAARLPWASLIKEAMPYDK